MRVIVILPALLVLASVSACQREGADVADVAPPSAATTEQAARSTPAELQRYEGRGRIATVDRSSATVTLDHEAIADLGWPSRTMSFDVEGEGIPKTLSPGDEVRFTLRQGHSGRLIITDIDAASLATAEVDQE